MSSRRLKHLNEEHIFTIKTKGSPDTEHKILSLVDEYVHIHQKYLAKGHTKLTEIKQIVKHVSFNQMEDGIQFKLKLDIGHYTNLYFNIFEYLARLNSELGLPPASIKTGNISFKQITTNHIATNQIATKQKSTMFL
jgi:hypothetical protein